MLLRTLKLENFMKHASKKIDFAPGVNLIVGPNAAGKSSIYDAIELVLTGRGSRYSNRSYYAGPNGDGYRVELELEHAGSVYLITYSYEKRSGSARLYRDGKLIAEKTCLWLLKRSWEMRSKHFFAPSMSSRECSAGSLPLLRRKEASGFVK